MNIGLHGGACGHACCLRIQDLSVKIGNQIIIEGINLHVHCGEISKRPKILLSINRIMNQST